MRNVMMPRIAPQPRVTIVMLQRTAVTRTLPPSGPVSTRPLRHSRPLRGEIVCDETGELYERVGQYVRRVHNLVTGPSGELLDVNPAGVIDWNPAEATVAPTPPIDHA